MAVLVLQHIACEPPGAYADVLADRGLDTHVVELDEGDRLPEQLSGIDAVVVMGGPMSANDDAVHPWLRAERTLIGAAVRAGVPVWGSCLGVQLMAAALGAAVHAGPAPEVGVLPVFATDPGRDDPVLGPCRWPLMTLQWHGDTFGLPDGAVLLASSPAYPHQAMRVGRTAYGVQFHLEVDSGMADEWAKVPEYVDYAERVLGRGGAANLLDAVKAAAPEMLDEARGAFSRWVDLWG